ncbi:MAG: PEP-CTERM sorting domain-containing protein [Planctomycetes bacterium]|nr:PEP-CTERM sorting domain-containing protein [Planctomycetota bacterium]
MDANPGATGRLFFSLDGGTTGSAKITWDAAGAGLPAATDLTDAGASTFISFDIISIDSGSVDLFVSVTDQSNVVGTKLLSGAGAGTQQFPFASFTGTPNFADVKSIVLEIRGISAGSDLVLDQIFSSGEITNVPEPSTYVLGIFGFVGMMGLAVIRRRRPAA